MKISVLVPIYKVENYIKECAESLFTQTYQDIEFIFVDDCSPDKSIDVLRQCVSRYPAVSSKTKLIRHTKNRGLAAVRQTGIDAATGDFVAFVDSDDYLYGCDAIEKMARKQMETDADIVECGHCFTAQNQLRMIYPDNRSRKCRILSILLRKTKDFGVWGKLFRKSLFTDHHILFSEGIGFGEDYSVIPCLLLVGRRALLNEVAYYYRRERPGSYCASISLESLFSFIRAMRVVELFFSKENADDAYVKAINLAMLSIYVDCYDCDFSKHQVSLIEQKLDYHPRFLTTRLLYFLLHNTYPSRIVRRIYRSTRRLYLYLHC